MGCVSPYVSRVSIKISLSETLSSRSHSSLSLSLRWTARRGRRGTAGYPAGERGPALPAVRRYYFDALQRIFRISAFRRLRTKVANGLHDTSSNSLALGHQFLR